MILYRRAETVDLTSGDFQMLGVIADDARRAGIMYGETHPLTRWAWGMVSEEVEKLVGQESATGIFYYDAYKGCIYKLVAL